MCKAQTELFDLLVLSEEEFGKALVEAEGNKIVDRLIKDYELSELKVTFKAKHDR